MYTIVQGCIDLGLNIISKMSLRPAESSTDVFNVLQENNLISREIATKLKRMARFRDILAHQYTKLDPGKIMNMLQNNLDDVKTFLSELVASLEKNT